MAYPQLNLYRNIAIKLAWTGGPSGPKVFAVESTGYLQPYLTTYLVTQYINLSFPGWKHMRRAFPALISCAPVTMRIRCQDGRLFGPYNIPSTNGQYRIIPFMLDQNLKDLAFSFELDGGGVTFAPFLQDFVIETKQWVEATYISLAAFRA